MIFSTTLRPVYGHYRLRSVYPESAVWSEIYTVRLKKVISNQNKFN